MDTVSTKNNPGGIHSFAAAFLFSYFFIARFVFVHRNRLRVFVFRIFVFSFASKALAVDII